MTATMTTRPWQHEAVSTGIPWLSGLEYTRTPHLCTAAVEAKNLYPRCQDHMDSTAATGPPIRMVARIVSVNHLPEDSIAERS
jgi:hypothetical protein